MFLFERECEMHWQQNDYSITSASRIVPVIKSPFNTTTDDICVKIVHCGVDIVFHQPNPPLKQRATGGTKPRWG